LLPPKWRTVAYLFFSLLPPASCRGGSVDLDIALILESGHEFVHLFLGSFLGDSISLLNLPHQLFFLAVDGRQIVVGELSPLYLNLAFVLFPFTFELFSIHLMSPLEINFGAAPHVNTAR